MTDTWQVYRRNAELKRTGMLEFEQLIVNLRWLRGSRFTIDGHLDDLGAVTAGDGLIITRNGETVLSGIVTPKKRTRDGDEDTVTVAGVDDLERINWRLIYPDPTLPADSDAQPGYDTLTGAAEDVLAAYVEANAGASALNDGVEDRRIPGLVVAAPTGRGDVVTGRGRWQPLVEYAATLAERGGVGFRAMQQLGTSTITFEATVPVERPGVRFDIDGLRGTGALEGFDYSIGVPEVTWAIAGGRGQLGDRLVRQDSQDVGRWGRIERFLDQNNAGDEADIADQQATLDDEIGDALRKGQATATLNLSAVDTAAARWGDDYQLGDWVRVRVDDAWMWRQVRELEVTVDANGEQVAPSLGDAASPGRVPWLRRISELEQRISERGRSQ